MVGSKSSPGETIEALRQRVLGAVAWFYKSRNFRYNTAPLLDAYLEYVRGRESFMEDLELSVSHFRKATQIDPSFYSAWVSMEVYYSNIHQCDKAQQVLEEMEAHLTLFTAFERLGYRVRQADLSGNWLEREAITRKQDSITKGGEKYSLGLASIALNKPRSAIESFRQIPEPTGERRLNSWALFWIARAHHMLDEYEQELDAANKYLEIFPSQWILHGRKVAALVALGRFDEVDQALDQAALVQRSHSSVMETMVGAAAEMWAHGNRDAAIRMANRAVNWWNAQPETEQARWRPLLADALVLAEKWPEAKMLADTLLNELESQDGPIEVEAGRARGGYWWGDGSLVVSLGRVGTLAARLDDFDTAHQISDRLLDLESSCPKGGLTYERACIASQLGNPDEAISLLRKAVTQGWYGFWAAETDFNLEPLRDHPDFVELMRPKG